MLLASSYTLGLGCRKSAVERGGCLEVLFSMFVCWVICFQVASILAAYLRYTRLRDPNHPRLGNR